MANEVDRRAHGQRVDKDRTDDGACANRQWNQGRDAMNVRHPSATGRRGLVPSRAVGENWIWLSPPRSASVRIITLLLFRNRSRRYRVQTAALARRGSLGGTDRRARPHG